MKICCIDGCTNECMEHRRYCEFHYHIRHRATDHARYVAKGKEPPPIKKFTCEACESPFFSRYKRKYCESCISKINSAISNTSYQALKLNGIRIDAHRKIAKDLGVLPNGRKDVVHHIDGDKCNNTKQNLLVLSLRDHGRLHAHLKEALLKNPSKSITELTWPFIYENKIPYFHCSDNPNDFEDTI